MARYRRDGPSIAICLFRFVLPPDVVANMSWLLGNRFLSKRIDQSSHSGKRRFPTVRRTSPRGRLGVPWSRADPCASMELEGDPVFGIRRKGESCRYSEKVVTR